jgi:hypothetical protein
VAQVFEIKLRDLGLQLEELVEQNRLTYERWAAIYRQARIAAGMRTELLDRFENEAAIGWIERWRADLDAGKPPWCT